MDSWNGDICLRADEAQGFYLNGDFFIGLLVMNGTKLGQSDQLLFPVAEDNPLLQIVANRPEVGACFGFIRVDSGDRKTPICKIARC